MARKKVAPKIPVETKPPAAKRPARHRKKKGPVKAFFKQVTSHSWSLPGNTNWVDHIKSHAMAFVGAVSFAVWKIITEDTATASSMIDKILNPYVGMTGAGVFFVCITYYLLRDCRPPEERGTPLTFSPSSPPTPTPPDDSSKQQYLPSDP